MHLIYISYLKEKRFTSIIFITILFGIFSRVLVNLYGGQLFWFDEMRFNNGYILLTTIADGQYMDAIKRFITTYDHTLYQLIAVPLTVLRYYYCKLIVNRDTEPYFLMESDVGLSICSTLISIISYFVLVLSSLKVFSKYKLDWYFAIMPIILYTISSNITLFSRHLLPYEASISLYVLSLSFLCYKKFYLCGFFSTISFLTYNGFSATFISINIFVLILILFKKDKSLKNFFLYSLGTIFPIAILQGIGIFCEINYLSGLLDWANYASANQQGDFGIGYKLLPELFWQSESYLSFLIILPFLIDRKSKFYQNFKHLYWSIGFLCITIITVIILNSDLLKNSAVYSRTVIQLIPFLCCFVSIGLYYFYKKNGLIFNFKFNLLILLLVSIIFYNNFEKYIILDYPRSILSLNNIRDDAVRLSNFENELVNILPQDYSDKKFFITNCGQIYPGIKYYKDYNFSKIIKEWNHPYQYIPYQYMHFNQEERLLLNSNKINIIYGFINREN